MKLCYHCMSQISNDKASTCPVCGKSLDPEEQKPRFLKPGTVLGGKFVVGYHLGSGGNIHPLLWGGYKVYGVRICG